MRKHRESTATTLVLAALVNADDFLSLARLAQVSGVERNRLRAALCHLRVHKAVDFIVDGDATYWFATPLTDTRACTLPERIRESKPRKQRRIFQNKAPMLPAQPKGVP